MNANTLTESVVYPDSDGLPMAENTVQYRWITKLVGGLQTLFRDDPNVFVAGDLLWYPVKGSNTTRIAPDAMVAIGRPKGDRGSYRQWVEGGIAPQVVFEVLSPGNTPDEMKTKLAAYDGYGVEEYYVIDPDVIPETVEGWRRSGMNLARIPMMEGWLSPLLGIRFTTTGSTLEIFGPDGRAFEDYVEVAERAIESERQARLERRRARKATKLAVLQGQRADLATQLAEQSARQAVLERQRAEQASELAGLERQLAEQSARQAVLERQRADQAAELVNQERQRAERLAEKLRSLGIDVDD